MTDLARRTGLIGWIESAGPLAVAVSGGVDSLTLATVAAQHSTHTLTAFHAGSAAVPAAAADRVRSWAADRAVPLELLDAGELHDPRYLANPVDRCRFCKTDLYGAIAARSSALIVSGTNTDDLAEWRPGLSAAAAAGVRHPFVECGISKSTVRSIAREYGLDDVADLPAGPCLASRIATGLPIVATQLQAIDSVETEIAQRYGPGDIRCRITSGGVVIELADAVAARLGPHDRRDLARSVEQRLGLPLVRFAPYRRGSAFLGVPVRQQRSVTS